MDRLRLYISTFLIMFSSYAIAQDATYTTEILAPGYTKLTFEAPKPGAYTLASYKAAKNGNIIDSSGSSKTLHDIYENKVVLLNFMYSTCTDVNGCPLATAVFHKIRNILNKDPSVGKNVSLVSLSFDPQNDTPDVMKLYGSGTSSGVVDWKFFA